MFAAVVELPQLLVALFAQILHVVVGVRVLVRSAQVGVAPQHERTLLADEVLPDVRDVESALLLFGRLVFAVARYESVVERVAGLCVERLLQRVVGKLVGLVAVRSRLLLVRFASLLV